MIPNVCSATATATATSTARLARLDSMMSRPRDTYLFIVFWLNSGGWCGNRCAGRYREYDGTDDTGCCAGLVGGRYVSCSHGIREGGLCYWGGEEFILVVCLGRFGVEVFLSAGNEDSVEWNVEGLTNGLDC